MREQQPLSSHENLIGVLDCYLLVADLLRDDSFDVVILVEWAEITLGKGHLAGGKMVVVGGETVGGKKVHFKSLFPELVFVPVQSEVKVFLEG